MKALNAKRLDDLRKAFVSLYDKSFTAVEPLWNKVAMLSNSTTAANTYGWLGELPSMRKWVGDRVIRNLKNHGYTIVNDDYELTVNVKRNDIDDDNIGVYAPMVGMAGDSAARLPDELVFALLAAGFDTTCYDGQFFFDTDHPVADAEGVITSHSNSGGGSGAAWFLLDTTRPIKPIIYQERKKPEFVAMDDPKDANVFNRKEYLYGVDGRCAVGFGLWQLAFGSKQDLTEANFAAARAAMIDRTTDGGKKMAIKPNLLVVGATNEKAALEIIKAERAANGKTNVFQGISEVLVVPYL